MNMTPNPAVKRISREKLREQGGRSPTGEAPESSAAPLARATTEVVPATARRRQFSPAYKRRIVRAAEACKDQPGAIGRLLCREGLYSSTSSAGASPSSPTVRTSASWWSRIRPTTFSGCAPATPWAVRKVLSNYGFARSRLL